MRELTPFEKGYHAFKLGCHCFRDNPYVEDTFNFYEWEGGFFAAEDDERMETDDGTNPAVL